ncbi:MAG: outer membrane protein assembly factor BamA, partial [Deltaproteobacteria bacterium]|nr:outer membrane protein assembly factor BamA [Deltaproteobacteria bacterium]
SLSLQATLSSIRQYVNLHFGEPHFLDTNWLFSFDLFKYQYDFDDFMQGSNGASFTLGYQLTDDLQLSFTYELAQVDFERRSRPEDSESGLTSSIKGLISLDTRDDRWLPTRGWWVYLSQEIADDWLFSENEFSRTIFSARYYHPLLWKVVAMARLEYGMVQPLGERRVPEFERFRVGGIQSVRGFRRLSLAPEVWRQGYHPEDPLVLVKEGGNEEVVANFELIFPIFEQVGIQGVLFSDMGMAYHTDGTILMDPERLWRGLRASWGFGFRWFSPIGPLRFEWGFPNNPLPGEDTHLFEFTIGNF